MKKKVLFLMPAMLGGGAEKVLADLLRHFDYARFDVTLYLEFREGPYLKDVPAQVRVLSLHKSNNIWLQRLHRRLTERGWYATFHERIYRPLFCRRLRGERFDAIVSFMEGSVVKFHSYVADRAARNLSWIHIDLVRKHWSLDFFRNAQDEQAAYRLMDRIVFVSEDAQRSFQQLYPTETEKCTVLYNLIDCEEIIRQSAACPIEKRRFTICMAGRLNRQKRYDRALEVARLLKADGYDAEFWILGEGELEDELKGMAKELGMEDRVRFLGFVKPPYAYMRQADLLLLTSESEGLPVVICEAFCLGLPVVSTAITGPTELIGQSQAGLLTREAPEDICRGIECLIDKAPLRQEYARNALRYAQTFSVQATMKRIYELIG